MFHPPPSTDLTARGAEPASRSDTGLRKQTGEGEAFTGGGMLFPPKMESVPIFEKERGRAHRNEYRSFALSKDGSMLWDDGRRTYLPLLTLFSEGFYYVNRNKKGRLKASSSRPAGSY